MILRETTRASNPAWYQDALELNFQIHIRANGANFSTFYYQRKKNIWTEAPPLSEDVINDPANLDAFAASVIKYAQTCNATSVGVILHVADEFAKTELKPEFDNPSAIQEIREAAIVDPATILEDSSIQADQGSWRVIPYTAPEGELIGTTITISNQYAAFLGAMRNVGENENFPVITRALSAPLIALMGLSQVLQPTKGKPFVTILQYSWFTALAFFDENAELRLLRTLRHRGLRRPTKFRDALATTDASLEFVDPDLFLVPLCDSADPTLAEDLRTGFPKSRVETVQQLDVEGLPNWCPEPVIAVTPPVPGSALISSQIFSALREDKWAFQDFLPTPAEIVEIYPSRTEMRLLKLCRFARVALFAVVAVSIGYMGIGAFKLTRLSEWGFDPDNASLEKVKLSKLNADKLKADHWNNLLDDRSKAWVSMESLVRMFPETGGTLVKSYTHSAKTENTPGLAKIGFIKEWKITGFARDEVLEYLNTLNSTEGISAHFNEIARITGNGAFLTNVANRLLEVNLRTQENQAFKVSTTEEPNDADESTYPFTFDLTIRQRFNGTDPLAITVAKAP